MPSCGLSAFLFRSDIDGLYHRPPLVSLGMHIRIELLRGAADRCRACLLQIGKNSGSICASTGEAEREGERVARRRGKTHPRSADVARARLHSRGASYIPALTCHAASLCQRAGRRLFYGERDNSPLVPPDAAQCNPRQNQHRRELEICRCRNLSSRCLRGLSHNDDTQWS
jgi:hypothetical protein